MPSKTITLRVPDDVLEAFDAKVIAAGTNRSASIVSFMRTVAGVGPAVSMAQGSRAAARKCAHPDEKLERHDKYTMCVECGARVA